MAKTVAIVGAGQIGHAATLQWYEEGFEVSIYARSKPPWWNPHYEFIEYVRPSPASPAADIVLDTIAFDEADVAAFDPERIGRLIVISSASVYCDEQGRTLDEAGQNGWPEFDVAISEEQTTVAPGPATYSTRKIRMENKARELFGERATILRPCAIYGQWSRHPREWWFVKRILDQRTRIPLAYGGNSRFHTTDVTNLIGAARNAAEEDIGGVFNIGDPNPPSVREIGESIARVLNSFPELISMDESNAVGRTPWSVPNAFLISTAKADNAWGQWPLDYEENVGSAVHWLVRNASSDWKTQFPVLASYPYDLFDYEAEDRFLASL